jgi:ribosomal protein L23
MNQERVFKVLLGPHVSEKATVLAEKKGQFVFKVATDATKLEIKKAVESLFNVKVENVSTVNVLVKPSVPHVVWASVMTGRRRSSPFSQAKISISAAVLSKEGVHHGNR